MRVPAKTLLPRFNLAMTLGLGLLGLLLTLGLPRASAQETQAIREDLARIVLFFKDIADEEATERLYRKAVRLFEKHLEAHPDAKSSDQARFYLAECQWHLKEKEEAVKGYLAAAGSSDNRLSSKCHVRLADHLYAEKKYREAMEHFRAVVKLGGDPDEVLRCRLHVGLCHSHLGEEEEARGIFNALIAEVKTGIIASTAKRALVRLQPEGEAMGARKSIRKYLAEFEEHQKTGKKERKAELAESIRTNLEDWDGLDHPKILPLLKQIIGTRKHPFGGNAVRELVQIGSPEALGELEAALREKAHPLQQSIISALVAERVFVDDSVVEAIFRDKTQRNVGLRLGAADYIVLRDTAAVVETLYDEIMIPGDKRVKINAALNDGIRRALQRLKSSGAAGALRAIVADDQRHPVHRKYAIEALGHIGDPVTVDVLVPLLQERQLDIVSLAAEALGRTGDERAREPMLELLRKKPKDARVLASLLRGLDRLEMSPAEEELFLFFAKSKDHSIRVLAHALLRQTWGEGARLRLRDALSDKVWQVRWHAIRAMGQNPSAQSVTALIGRLPKEDGRLKFEILKYLHRLTGEDLGLDPKVWKKWWAGVQDSYDPASVKLAALALGPDADQTVSASDSPQYFSLKVSSKNAIFVIDVSGSMIGLITVPQKGESTGSDQEKKIVVAKRELIAVLRKFDKRARFNIIWFSTSYKSLWKGMKNASKGNVGKACKAVRGLSAAGATNIFDSLALALQDPRVDTIYLLSDGEPNQGAFTNPDDIIREINNLNYTRKVAIHTIYLGGDSWFMKELAEQNHGQYVPVAK